MSLLAGCLALALVLALVLAAVLPGRIARIVTAQVAAATAEREASAAELAVILASLRVLLADLERSRGARSSARADTPRSGEPGAAPSSASFARDPTVSQTARLEDRATASAVTAEEPATRPDAALGSRERPVQVGIDPPGSAPRLPPQPAIIAARLGPRPDPATSRHRGEAPRRTATLAGVPPIRRSAHPTPVPGSTLPSMPAFGSATAPPSAPRSVMDGPEDESSTPGAQSSTVEVWPPRGRRS
jgi:hypothetical protein